MASSFDFLILYYFPILMDPLYALPNIFPAGFACLLFPCVARCLYALLISFAYMYNLIVCFSYVSSMYDLIYLGTSCDLLLRLYDFHVRFSYT